MKKASERLADLIDPDPALREAAWLAYADIRQLCDASGRLLPLHEWPDGAASAVSSIEIRSGEDATAVVKVKLWDKTPSLALLFKHLGLLEPRVVPSDKTRPDLVILIQPGPNGPPVPLSQVLALPSNANGGGSHGGS